MYRLLIVEDEYLLRSELLLCEDWMSMGFETPLMAEDGEQGLTAALTQNPDVILTDIRMPKLDGLQMIGELRRQKNECLCIVLSGYDDFTYAVEALRYGVIDYLVKPVDDARLRRALAAAVERLNECRAEAAALPETDKSIDENGGNLYLEKASAYLQEHYAEDVRLTDLAQKLYLSDAYLGRLFIRHYHMKFTDYLHQVRLRNAMPLLRDPKLKIYQVAQMTGYSNQQYFCSVFRKMIGISPYQFRHNLRVHFPEEDKPEE